MKDLLVGVAKKAGELLLENFRKPEFSEIAVRKGTFDYSIKMDQMCENFIIEQLKQGGFKGKILSEEGGKTSLGNGNYILYIDPIDGTFNYAHGIAHYAVSIGAEQNGELAMGVIYDPSADELFFAEKGKGAYLNNNRIHVSKTSELRYSVINLFSRTLKDNPEMTNPQVNLIRNAYVRMPMSAVLALAYTACGRTDATVGSGQNKWDIAAGALLVQEAGGLITTINGGKFTIDSPNLLASNGIIHGKILETLMVR